MSGIGDDDVHRPCAGCDADVDRHLSDTVSNDVGEGFLNDAINGQLQPGRQPRQVGRDVEHDTGAGLANPVDQGRQVRDHRLRAGGCRAVAGQGDEATHFFQRGACGVLDVAETPQGRVLVLVQMSAAAAVDEASEDGEDPPLQGVTVAPSRSRSASRPMERARLWAITASASSPERESPRCASERPS